MNVETLILSGSISLQVFLLFLILLHSKLKISKIFFILTLLGITLWFIVNYLSNFEKNYYKAIFWNKAIFAFSALASWAFMIFALTFPDKRIPKKYFFLSLLFLFCVFLTSFSNLIVKDIKIKEKYSEIIFGPAIYFYIFFLISSIFIAFGNIFKVFFSTRNLSLKSSLKSLLWGMGIFIFLSILTNLLFPVILKKFELTNLVPLYAVFFTTAITIAILKYEFLGMKVILTEILVGVIGVLLIIQIFMVPTILWKIINGAILILFGIFGYLLIQGVLKEIERRTELERISQAKSEFLSITSHQLRTPLSAIKGYLSMIAEGIYGEIPERLKKPLKNVYLSNERLIKLVNDLLDISRIEAGKMEMKFERTNLEELINEVVSELEIEAKKKGLYLKFEKPKEKLPQILIDKEKIRQVILNIVDNAIKYTKEGGATIRLKRVGNSLQIAVSDTGIGMTKEEIAKLFESFSRGAGGRKSWVEGAGLGLYISKKLIDLHQGKIWAESEGRGKGSTFFVELPIK